MQVHVMVSFHGAVVHPEDCPLLFQDPQIAVLTLAAFIADALG